VQFVAKLIEKLMARIQIICRGTTVRLQHSSSLQLVNPRLATSKAETLDYEVEIRLPYIAYRDETPGWDQSTTGREPASMAASTVYGTESTSGSTMLEDSVIPSVIWQDTPESIKTVTFKGFSIWIKQSGPQDELLANVDPTPQPSPQPPLQQTIKTSVEEASGDDQSMSDSDSDVFADAQENFSQSMVASKIISRPTPALTPPLPAPLPTRSTHPIDQSRLYQAEILSTLQHKNRVKVNIRKNTTMLPGPNSTQAPSTIRSLFDIDFSIKSIFIALSPNQIAFLLEILSMMDHAPPPPPSDGPKQNLAPAYQTGINKETRDELGHTRDHITSRGPIPILRSENSTDRPSTLHNSRSMSPKQRSPPVDLLRVPLNRSPGGPTQEPDKHVDARNPRTTIPTPAVFLDSSRFLSGSTYSEHRPGSSTPSGTTTSVSPTLTVKLKAKIGTFQMFFLYRDPQSFDNIPTEGNFFKSPNPKALKVGHLKLELDSMVLKYQQWASTGVSAGGQKSAKHNKGQVDFTLSNFAVSEWIDAAPRPYDNAQDWDRKVDQFRLPLRKSYIPIIEFDAAQDSLYQTSSNSKFPTLQLPDRYITERCRTARTKSSARPLDKTAPPFAFSEHQGISKDPTSTVTKEVVRMRVMLSGKKDVSGQSALSTDATQTASSGTLVRDVTIEVKPAHMHLDFFMFQRLEKVLLALMSTGSKPESSSSHIDLPRSPRGIEQQIMDDLDGPRKPIKVCRSQCFTARY
jgi:hypothetical protein